jgi:hypothetical protein
VPYLVIDKIAYQNTAPWPTNAGDASRSLQRRSLNAYGNDPTNWFAALPTAGRHNTLSPAPTINSISQEFGVVRISVTTGPGLTYQLEYKNDLGEPTWTPISPPLAGDGAMLTLSDTNRLAPARFYRIRAE